MHGAFYLIISDNNSYLDNYFNNPISQFFIPFWHHATPKWIWNPAAQKDLF